MPGIITLFVILLASLGPSIIVALIGRVTIQLIGRYPSQASRIFLGKIVILIFAEALAIGVFLAIFNIYAIKTPRGV